MARPLRNVFGHETGLRILIGYLAREAAQLDKGIRPILCFYADHYFRCFLKVVESAAAAEASLENLGYLGYDAYMHERALLEEAGPDRYGPLWLGRILDPEVMQRMSLGESLQQGARCAKYLELWRNELDVPFFYENNELSSLLRTSPLEMEDLLARLRSEGRASRTHFSPTGFKTDLPLESVKRLYLDVA
jgi:tRNA (guanine26-N2/guanine27-N2)-dimethyltransferase